MIERYKCDAEMYTDLIQLHLWMVKDVLDDPNSLKEIIIFQHFETVFPKQLSDE